MDFLVSFWTNFVSSFCFDFICIDCESICKNLFIDFFTFFWSDSDSFDFIVTVLFTSFLDDFVLAFCWAFKSAACNSPLEWVSNSEEMLKSSLSVSTVFLDSTLCPPSNTFNSESPIKISITPPIFNDSISGIVFLAVKLSLFSDFLLKLNDSEFEFSLFNCEVEVSIVSIFSAFKEASGFKFPCFSFSFFKSLARLVILPLDSASEAFGGKGLRFSEIILVACFLSSSSNEIFLPFFAFSCIKISDIWSSPSSCLFLCSIAGVTT